jgi:uncharacterized paraquat-inducible protein A
LENQSKVKEELFLATRRNMWLLVKISLLGFWLTGAISVTTSPMSPLELVLKNYWILGTIITCVATIVLFLLGTESELRKAKAITLGERISIQREIRRLDNLVMVCGILFGLFLVATPIDVLGVWLYGDLFSTAIFTASLLLLGLAVLANSLANRIKK